MTGLRPRTNGFAKHGYHVPSTTMEDHHPSQCGVIMFEIKSRTVQDWIVRHGSTENVCGIWLCLCLKVHLTTWTLCVQESPLRSCAWHPFEWIKHTI